jgi:hypothetical protein
VRAPAPKREWVTVTGRVVFPENRDLPKPREITREDRFVKDAGHLFAGGRRLFFEDVVIDPKTRGIKNVVVWLRPDSENFKEPFPRDKVHPAPSAAKPREHVIETGRFQFTPRVVVARAGDALRFRNTAPVAHAVDYTASGGWAGVPRMFNVLLPPGGEHTPFTRSMPLPAVQGDAYHSNIHPWMKGHVWAFDHPYAAVTDERGRFVIPNAPVGTWRLVIWHEKVGHKGREDPRIGEKVTVTDRDGRPTDLGSIPLDSELWDESNKKE